MADVLWMLNVNLQGGTLHNKTSLNFVLEYKGGGQNMTFDEAKSASLQILGALDEVCDAVISSARLSNTLVTGSSMPDITVDTADEAVILCHVNSAGAVPKFATVRIPAPTTSEVFTPDGETVDVGNGNLVQYIQQLAQHTFVSDGEQIQTSQGQDGMAYGYKRSRAKKYA